MSYATTQMQGSMAEPPQPGLQSLVQELNWSYVALWSFNPQTRNLEWQEGHWRHSDIPGWNEQYFNSTYKPCKFRTHFGSVGMAFADGKNIWRNGPKVLDNAGSKEQAEFLQRVRISTAIFIPWSDGVLELGTCENWPENLGLMESIREYFMNNIVPTLGQQGSGHSQLSTTSMQPAAVVAPSSFPSRSLMQQPSSYSSLSPLRHMSENLNLQSFEPNSLNQQIIRRVASMNPDMFLQEEDVEGKEIGNLDGGSILLEAARPWKNLPTLSMQQQTAPMSSSAAAANQVYYPPVQQRTRGQYRSRSGTTSSSVSSLEEAASTRLSAGDSTEQNMLFMANSSQRQTSHSNTSSSPRRGTSSRSPEMNQLVNTMEAPLLQETPSTVEDEIQLDAFLADAGEPLESGNMSSYSFPSLETAGNMSHMSLVDVESNGRNNNNNNNNSYNGTQTTLSSSVHEQRPFKSWRHTRILAPVLQKKKDRQTNQVLLRRCIDIMKRIPHSNPYNNLVPAAAAVTTAAGASYDQQAVMHNVGQHGPRLASSSSPETVVTDGISHDPFDQVPPRVQRRPRGGSRIASMGPVHSGHDEAAMNHMLAERRRRVKQKENFAALRRLVPIISKADKASILGDAIVYLKDLQNQIDGLEASRAESERRYETLQKSYQELEQRNVELESMVRPTRLHSM